MSIEEQLLKIMATSAENAKNKRYYENILIQILKNQTQIMLVEMNSIVTPTYRRDMAFCIQASNDLIEKIEPESVSL